jgi:hypothetical protein
MPNDFKLLFAKNVKVLAEWILTRPDDLGEFLIDDDNGIGCSGVGGGEFASVKQRNAQTGIHSICHENAREWILEWAQMLSNEWSYCGRVAQLRRAPALQARLHLT